MSLSAVSDLYQRARAVMGESQTSVDALVVFLTARAALEDNYSKALAKLAKNSLVVDGESCNTRIYSAEAAVLPNNSREGRTPAHAESTMDPTLFEAVASMHGDISNESVQHKELSTSITHDVVEPLKHLKESATMVARVVRAAFCTAPASDTSTEVIQIVLQTAQARSATSDVRASHERCKKIFHRYSQLYRRAVEVCTAAGVAAPEYWDPSFYQPRTTASGPPDDASRNGVNAAEASNREAADAVSNLSGKLVDVDEAHSAFGSGKIESPPSDASPYIPPHDPVSTSRWELPGGSTAAESMHAESSAGNRRASFHANSSTTSAGLFKSSTGRSFSVTGTLDSRLRNSMAEQLSSHRTATELDMLPPLHSKRVFDSPAAAPAVKGSDNVPEPKSELDDSTNHPRPHVHAATASMIPAADAPASPLPSAAMTTIHRANTNASLLGNFGDLFASKREDDLADLDSVARSDSFAGIGAMEDSFDDSASITSDLSSHAWGHRFTRFASMIGFGSNNAMAAQASMTTAERVDMLQHEAGLTIHAAEAAKADCEEAWDAHAKARDAFMSHMNAAVTIFQEIEKQRVTEMCDSLRKYSIYVSSMLANLQYDVQRLATKIEDAGNTAAEKVPARFEVGPRGAKPVHSSSALLTTRNQSEIQPSRRESPPSTPAAGHVTENAISVALTASAQPAVEGVAGTPTATTPSSVKQGSPSAVSKLFRFGRSNRSDSIQVQGSTSAPKPGHAPTVSSPLVPAADTTISPPQSTGLPPRSVWSRLTGTSPATKSAPPTDPPAAYRGKSRSSSMEGLGGLPRIVALLGTNMEAESPREAEVLHLLVEALFDYKCERVSSAALAPAVLETVATWLSREVQDGSVDVAHLSFAAFASGTPSTPEPTINIQSLTNFRIPEWCKDINPVVQVLLPAAAKIMQTKEDALGFLVKLLELRRGEGTLLSSASYAVLVQLVKLALDCASTRRDFSRGRSIMVIAQTFYCYLAAGEDAEHVLGVLDHPPISSLAQETSAVTPVKDGAGPASAARGSSGPRGGRRLYLQSGVRDHPLWRHDDFWEAVVMESVAADAMKAKSEGRSDRGDREQEVTIGQFSFFAYNMLAFGVPSDRARFILEKAAKGLKLSPSTAAQIAVTFDRVCADHERQQQVEEEERQAKLAPQTHQPSDSAST